MTARDRRIHFLQREVLRFETMERVTSEAKAAALAELRELGGKRLPRRRIK